jgi:hypothetical protein
MYTLKNDDTALPLCTIGGPASFFRRGRLIYNGALIEDIDFYNRTDYLFHTLTAEANRNNDDLEGFGFRWDDNAHYPVTGLDRS